MPGGGGADPPPALTVLAASSLTGAFEQIGADFERTHPGTSVTFSFGASSTLATQIRSGVPADVFASASAAELEAAVPDAPTPRTFATNVMTIAVPAANPARVTSLTGLADPAVRVALCQPAAPCGRAAAAIFAKAGLEVSAKPAQGGAAIVPAVISGENQFGFSNVVSLLTARDKGLPLVSIAAGVSSTGDPADDVNAVLVGKGSTLKTAKDLEGRKIAVNSLNNIGDTTVKTAVTKAGGDPAKVTFVEMPFPDMPAQLAAGTIDAAWEAEPFRTQIVAAGGRILFDNLTETYPTLQISHYFTSAQTKQKNPAMVTAFVTCLLYTSPSPRD